MSHKPIPITYPEELPIAAAREEIIAAIRAHRVVIVAGDTGSGKSTQLPKMCLEAGQGATRLIGCTQPRRLAATSVAQRVGEELGPEWTRLVGCKIRFSDRTSPETRIKFMTDGILLAETRRDRELAAYDTIIIDEAHERSLNIDFLLGILRRLLERRHDLKIIITSATIDTGRFAEAFGGAPVIKVAGRAHPVELRYQPPPPEAEESGHVEQAVAAVLDLHRSERGGDMLVFLPTERDIRDTVEGIEKGLGSGPDKAGATVLPLFGRLSARDQQRIFGEVAGRKIVVATNVAETSITVPGIRFVVDSGLARISIYNPRARTSKLPVRPVSRASADQRKGRCGRTGPGICVRLYSEEDYLGRDEFTRPEIQRADLAEVILRMIALHLGDPARFPFLDPPAPRAIRDGYNLLLELGAIEMAGDRGSARLTPRGKVMAELPLDPRIARMVIEAREQNVLSEVCVIGAALSIPDPRVRPAEREKEADRAHAAFAVAGSDFLSFLAIWAAVERLSAGQLRRFCRDNFLSWQRLREWRDIHEQLTGILNRQPGFRFNAAPAHPNLVHRAILSGNLRNLGLRSAKNLYQSSQDKEVMIFPGSALYNKGGKWIMAAEMVETSRLFARCVANIEPEWIEPLAGHLCRYSWAEPHWERKRGQVVAFENVTLFGLLIEARRRVNYGAVKPDEARQIFIQQGLVEGEIGEELSFLAHNQALAARLEELEDRVRQRDILVDETAIFEFYEKRLPPEINDRAGLKKLLKRSGGDSFLRMGEEDLLHRAPAAERLADYPESLDCGGFTLRLSYRFQPGAEDDGVSVHVPVELLPQVEPARFEWLVPGLLPEKLLFLLKGLPKTLRRPLVPVPEAARRLNGDLRFGGGNFYAVLQELIWKFYQVRVTRGDWPATALPEHLRVRYCLEDRQGRVVKTSRDFGQLAVAPGAAAAGSGGLLTGLRKRWERGSIIAWDFAGLAERLPIQGRDGLVFGYAFPGLEPEEGDSVRLRLFSDDAERRLVTGRGLLVLYGREFGGFKGLKKDFALGNEHWALLEGLGDRAELNRALLEFILIEVFGTRAGLIPTAEEFAATVSRVKGKGLYPLGRELFDQLVLVLRERRAVLDLLHRCESLGGRAGLEKFTDCRRRLEQLLPPDFLSVFDSRRLRNTQRYLLALARRVERAHVDPLRDRARAAQVLLHEERLAEFAARPLYTPELRQLLEDFREMVDEFRISLFAQEIKTIYPISEKRLAAKWVEIREQAGF